MGCPLCDRLKSPDPAPLVRIAAFRQSTAFLNDQQGCAGWCVLVLNRHVEHLDELPEEAQVALFAEVSGVARAIRAVHATTGAGGGPPRINYECLGNQTAHVHWHVIPRHADDPEPRKPVWGWPEERLAGSMTRAERVALAAKIRGALPR